MSVFIITLQSHLEWYFKVLVTVTFYQKSNQTYNACVLSRLPSKKRGPSRLYSHLFIMNVRMPKALNWNGMILNGDSRCQRMYMPSLILIRCHNQLLFKQTTTAETSIYFVFIFRAVGFSVEFEWLAGWLTWWNPSTDTHSVVSLHRPLLLPIVFQITDKTENNNIVYEENHMTLPVLQR